MNKKALIILFLLTLSGCRVRDTARLRSVETMGIDLQDENVILSISTGEGTEKLHPLHLSAEGVSIHDCMAKLEECAEGQELFYAHLRFLVLGESASADLAGFLDYFERAPELRLAIPVYVVQGDASPLLTDAEHEIGSLLRSLQRSGEQSGICRVSTLLELDCSLREDGQALCAAIANKALSGYALLRPGEKTRFSDAQTSLGLTLLYRGLSYAEFTIPLPDGKAAVETQNLRPGRKCAYTLRELSGKSSVEELNAAVSSYLECAESAALSFLGSSASPLPCPAELKRGYDLTRSDSP